MGHDESFYSSSAFPITIVFCITFSTALIVTTPLLYAISREPSIRTRKIDQANLVVILGTFIWAFCCLFVALRRFAIGETDSLNCQIEGFGIAVGAGWEVSGQSLMAFDRYTTIATHRKLSNQNFFVVLCSLLFILLIAGVIPLVPGFEYLPQDDTAWCFYGFSSQDPKHFVFGIIVIIFGAVSLNVMLIAYYLIYRKVQAEKKIFEACNIMAISAKDTTYANGSTEAHSVAKTQQEKISREQALFIRCIAILTVFLVSFLPEYVIFTYEVIVHHPAPPILGQLATAVSTLDTSLSPLVSIYFNKEYQKAILKHVFGYKDSFFKNY